VIRVAAIIDSLGLGGAERLLVTLGRQAPGAEVDLTVMALRHSDSSLVADALLAEGVPVQLVPTARHHQLADRGRLTRLTEAIQRSGAEVVHTHLGAANVLGGMAARRARIPVVATLHNVRIPSRHLRDRMEQAAVRRSDAVLAVGEEVARSHAPSLRRPVRVLCNPVDIDAMAPTGDIAGLRMELLGQHSGPLLVTVGRLEAQKGHEVLLRAHRMVRSACPDAVLVLVGEGSLAPALERRCRELGIVDSVRLLGARPDVPNILAAADLFVSASHYEGLPLAVLEAMAAGVPVVATAVGDVPEVLGPAGLTVAAGDARELADAVVLLLGASETRARMSVLARARAVERYDPSTWAKSLRSLYESVLADAGTSVPSVSPPVSG
jgi:glycosyltransferase involved in cell wall biosynthesis